MTLKMYHDNNIRLCNQYRQVISTLSCQTKNRLPVYGHTIYGLILVSNIRDYSSEPQASNLYHLERHKAMTVHNSIWLSPKTRIGLRVTSLLFDGFGQTLTTIYMSAETRSGVKDREQDCRCSCLTMRSDLRIWRFVSGNALKGSK